MNANSSKPPEWAPRNISEEESKLNRDPFETAEEVSRRMGKTEDQGDNGGHSGALRDKKLQAKFGKDQEINPQVKARLDELMGE